MGWQAEAVHRGRGPHKTATAPSGHLPQKQLCAAKALLVLLPQGALHLLVSLSHLPFFLHHPPLTHLSVIPPLCFPHISGLLVTHSPYSRGPRCSTVTPPLSPPQEKRHSICSTMLTD